MKAIVAVLGAGLLLLSGRAWALPPMTETPAACEAMSGRRIPEGAIGLPTRGATITGAASVTPKTGDAYCLVSGSIRPIDGAAPDIRFQVALPGRWNGKVVMFGGGGFNGVIPDVAGAPLNTPPQTPTPLAQGYVVFASDSGHQSKLGGADGSFMLNDEAYRNWLGDALKKTHDAALFVVATSYARQPTRSYFLGSSTGGREALRVAALWPQDWSGVVALYPARDTTALALKLVSDTQGFAAPGAYLSTAQRGLLHRAALEACDALDGAADGLISNLRGCYAVFDPATAKVDGRPLRCADGDAVADCLSERQLAALRNMESPLRLGFPLASGETSVPGYNVFTADTGIPSANPTQPFVSLLALGNAPPSFPATNGMALSAGFADNFVRFLVARDLGLNPLTFDIADPGPFKRRLSELSALDGADKDLSVFADRGGKVLILQGLDDLLISPRATEAYYAGLRSRMGAERVRRSIRFYEVPGFGHAVSTVFQASWDQLGALENWVERGRDPAEGQVVTDTAGVPGRTRPLCLYPRWPRYRGAGDPNSAAAFTCVAD